MTINSASRSMFYVATALTMPFVMLATLTSCRRTHAGAEGQTFATPQLAVVELSKAVKSKDLAKVMAIFGSDAQSLIDTSDTATARRNQQVFSVAVAEHWSLEDAGPDRKMLVVGFEEWPFPIPLVKDGRGWHFDTAAGKEEVLARRIVRNELAAIKICRTYVAAQKLYAKYAHDGKRAGIYAAAFRSDPSSQNGLYWPARHGQRRSPLGDLLSAASFEALPRRTAAEGPTPFHGYYFRILTAQGPAAPGGARNYVVNGELTGGFALIASPAQYDVTGIMTFVVNQDRVVSQRDLGPDTAAAARAISSYDPDSNWAAVQ
jgi:hypothetical protein